MHLVDEHQHRMTSVWEIIIISCIILIIDNKKNDANKNVPLRFLKDMNNQEEINLLYFM